MVDSVIQTRNLQLPNRGDTRHMFYTRHQHLCTLEVCASWAFQEREKTPTTELNIFLSKENFRQKITKFTFIVD